MPTSNLALWPLLLEKIAEVDRQLSEPVRVLDIGVGWGKAAMLIREYVNSAAYIGGVEAEHRYVTPATVARYDQFQMIRAEEVTDQELCNFHVVLMVDVIEHMTLDAGMTFVQRCPRWVVVCTPEEWFQNPEHTEYPFERHESLWTDQEFIRLGCSVEHYLGGIIAVRQP